MPKFNVKFLREFEVSFEAASFAQVKMLARQFLEQHPPGTTKLLSIIVDGYVEPADPTPPTKPFGRPNGGGSPGTPTVKVPELVDQIAKAA